MIARISSGSHVSGMVRYNSRKEISGEAQLIATNHIGITSENGIIQTLLSHKNLNPEVKKPNIHISLNFHQDDAITDKDLEGLSRDYMKSLGYDKQPYAVYQHFDASHKHVHIVSTRISEDGKRLSDSFEFRKSVRITEELEKKYGLVVAKESGKNKKDIPHLNTAISNYIETGRGEVKLILDSVLEEVLKMRPRNEQEFSRYLGYFSIGYHKNDSEKGDRADGLTYFFINSTVNEQGEEIKERSGKYLTASETTLKLTYNGFWNTFFRYNIREKYKGFKNIQGRIYAVINDMPTDRPILLDNFSTRLLKKGIRLNLLRAKTGDKKGVIVGLSFSDIKTGIKYNASELKLKWADLEKRITDDKSDLEQSVLNTPKLKLSPRPATDIMALIKDVEKYKEKLEDTVHILDNPTPFMQLEQLIDIALEQGRVAVTPEEDLRKRKKRKKGGNNWDRNL